MLVKHCSHNSAIHVNEKPGNRLYRPMVDEILRKEIGIDFGTASAVQTYISQLLETWKGSTQSEPLKAHRRKLRRDIVRRAQEIWERTVLDERQLTETEEGSPARQQARNNLMIVRSRSRWAPTSRLPQFLFPARLLTESNLWFPFDPTVQWLADPTLELETSRDVLRAGLTWIDRKAKEMVQNLVTHGVQERVTNWIRAAEQWHIRRLTRELYLGKYLNLEYGGRRLGELKDVPTTANNRLDVIAKKLRIDPLFPIGTLTDHERKEAVACFNKIVLQRCTGCPDNNLMIVPCGIKEVVHHYCHWHPNEFYLGDEWTIRG